MNTQIIYSGEDFKGQKFLTFAAVTLGVIASIYSIKTNMAQKRLNELQHEEALENKMHREAIKKAQTDGSLSSFDSGNDFSDTHIFSKKDVLLPNGIFNGLISGTIATVKDRKGKIYSFDTNVGVKGLNVPVRVRVLNSKAYIKL